MHFFPDKRGLAAGMAVMGLGGGSVLATPLIDRLLTRNFVAPTQIDEGALSAAAHSLSVNDKGQTLIDLAGSGSAGVSQIARLDCSDMLSAGFSSKIMSSLVDGGQKNQNDSDVSNVSKSTRSSMCQKVSNCRMCV